MRFFPHPHPVRNNGAILDPHCICWIWRNHLFKSIKQCLMALRNSHTCTAWCPNVFGCINPSENTLSRWTLNSVGSQPHWWSSSLDVNQYSMERMEEKTWFLDGWLPALCNWFEEWLEWFSFEDQLHKATMIFWRTNVQLKMFTITSLSLSLFLVLGVQPIFISHHFSYSELVWFVPILQLCKDRMLSEMASPLKTT